MDTLTVPDMIKDVVNSSVGKIIVLVLIAYLSDKCLTLSLMLAVAFCVMVTSNNRENFTDHGEEHHEEEHHEEEHHGEEHHEEEHHEEEHHEEEHHEEEHHEEEHHEEEHHEEDHHSEELSGIETFQNYATF